jgi:Glycosyltransferase family 87
MTSLSYRGTSAWSGRLPPAGLALAVGLSALVMAVRWHQDWGDSEGTYALTARSLLNGGDLYGEIVVAQPPVLFVVGAGVLAIGDSLELLRAVMVALQLLALALLATAVWRMTRSRWAMALTPALGALLPWTVHQQGSFQPEALALPCLAGALVLAPRRRGSRRAGALLAIAVGIKLPMAIPALLGLWAAADRRAAMAGFAATLAVLAAASLAVFGSGVVDDTVLAQLEVGRHAARPLVGVGLQAAWNLTPLAPGVLVAAAAWRRGWRTRDPRQGRVAMALGAGTALTLASTTKVGTSLSVMPPVEALLLAPAITGAALWLEGATLRRTVVAVALVAFLLAQSVSLLADPRRGGAVFLRPLSPPAWGIALTRREVDARVSALQRCPGPLPSSQDPAITFRAHRRMPGGQPDLFLPVRARRLAGVARRVADDRPRCP